MHGKKKREKEVETMRLGRRRNNSRRCFFMIALVIGCILAAACGKKEEEKPIAEEIVGAKETEKEQPADGEKEAEEGRDADTQQEKEADTEPEEEEPPVVLDASYLTRFGTANQVTFTQFVFEYPSSWQVVSEEVDQYHERVELSDGKNASVCFSYYLNGPAGLGRTEWYARIEKAAESQFVATGVQATDLSGLNPFMVASVTQENGSPMYAVMPESLAGQEGGFLGLPEVAFRFDYAGGLAFVAVGGTEGLDEQQTREVLAILSSFREA